MEKILEQYIFDKFEIKRVSNCIENFYEKNKEKLSLIYNDIKKENIVFIGLMGTIGSGKTTSQKIMNEIIFERKDYFCYNFNFSDLLKEFCYETFKENNFNYQSFYGSQRLKGYKNKKYYNLSGRALLQIIGTDIFRNLYDDEIWVKLSLARVYEGIIKMKDKKIVILCGDVRFMNEANAISQNGGYIIKIDRNFIINNSKMINYISNHVSEENVNKIEYDFIIDNNSNDINILNEKIKEVVKKMLD
jgi:energy-coupling factor transporter ATP-binding protein EcfA2